MSSSEVPVVASGAPLADPAGRGRVLSFNDLEYIARRCREGCGQPHAPGSTRCARCLAAWFSRGAPPNRRSSVAQQKKGTSRSGGIEAADGGSSMGYP